MEYQIFTEKELCGLSPNSYIHVSVRSIYFQDRSAYSAAVNRWTDRGNTQNALRNMDVQIGTVAAQLLFWEYINRNFFAVLNLRITPSEDNPHHVVGEGEVDNGGGQ